MIMEYSIGTCALGTYPKSSEIILNYPELFGIIWKNARSRNSSVDKSGAVKNNIKYQSH